MVILQRMILMGAKQKLGTLMVCGLLFMYGISGGMRAQTVWGEDLDSLVAEAVSMEKGGGLQRLAAIKTLRRAIVLATDSRPPSSRFFSDTYYLLGDYCSKVGYSKDAVDAYRKCADSLQSRLVADSSQASIPLAVDEMHRLLDVLLKLSAAYGDLGQRANGYAATMRAVQIADSVYGSTDTTAQEIVLRAASELRRLAYTDQAMQLARKSVATAKSSRKPMPRFGARGLSMLSGIFLAQGMLDSALAYVKEALPLLPKAALEDRRSLLLTQACCLVRKKNFEQGIPIFESLIYTSETTESPRECGILRIRYAQALNDAGRQRQALENLQCALTDFMPRFTEPSPEEDPDSSIWLAEPWVLMAFETKASCFAGLGNLDRAFKAYQVAFRYMDYLRQCCNLTEIQQSPLVQAGSSRYEEAIQLAYRTLASTGNHDFLRLAFQFMDRSKVNEILESLQEMEKCVGTRANQLLLDQYRYQRAEIGRLSDNPRQNARALERLCKSQQDLFPRIFPLSAALLRLPLAEPERIRAKLKRGETVVEYFLGDHTLYIFAIDSSHEAGHVVQLAPDFHEAVEKYALSISRTPGKIENSWERFAPYALRLYRQLVRPLVQSKFAENAPKLLTIVPDGRLRMLPFECLLATNFKGKEPFIEADYLGRFCNIRYGQSATTLFAQESRFMEGVRQGALALVAEPDGMPALQSGLAEGKAVVKAIDNSRLLQGAQASKASLLNQARDYRILFLGCSTVMDSLSHLDSWFALEQRKGKVDSFLVQELYGDTLNAEMVVLSAAGVDQGNVATGKSVMNLARAFQVAGCRTAVLPLWKVDEEPVAGLASNFYASIAKGKSASHSLQLARMMYLGSKEVRSKPRLAHPHYWASMVPIGVEGPHLPQLEVHWPRWLIWGSIAALIIALWQRRRRRRRARSKLR